MMSAYHGILLTRDDEDILDECIAHALSWCDHLYIYETGSFDRTWDIVQAWVAKDSRVQAFHFEGGQALMESGLRGYVFEHFRGNMSDGDWIAQVDSDEFYHVSPREFVAANLQPHETGVANLTYEFRLLESEAAAWDRADETMLDRQRPIEERRRHYNILAHTEPRMFRYRHRMQWPPHVAYPYNAALFSRARIPVRHYPQRDPVQLKRRWALRRILASRADPSWKHWQHEDWRELLARDGAADLFYWQKGEALQSDPHPPRSTPQLKRLAQSVVHSGIMRFLDITRPRFPVDFLPQRLPDTVTCQIADAYAAIDKEERAAGR